MMAWELFLDTRLTFLSPASEMLEPRSKGAKPASENKMGTGRGTLRLRAKGPATVEDLVWVSPTSCSHL